VKTTVEIQDALFRKAKKAAAAQGQTLKQLMNDALQEKLDGSVKDGKPPWMKLFGCLKDHKDELREIDARIEEEFERIDPEMWE
jgi:hypothetical protein